MVISKTPRFVISDNSPVDLRSGKDFSFSIRREDAPSKDVATLAVSAVNFPSAIHEAIDWSRRYAAAKMGGRPVAPMVRTSDGERMLLTFLRGSYAFVQGTGREPRAFWRHIETLIPD